MPRPETSVAAFKDGRQKLRVGLLVLDNFTLNAVSGFVEALRLAADTGGRGRQLECGWVIMGRGPTRASCGMTVTADSLPLDPSQFDYVAVAGGNDYRQRSQPAWLTNYLREADAAGKPLIGLCTGTFNIARAGLMGGRMACVHWNVYDEFVEQFPTISAISDRIFLDAGDRITCAGSTGSQDLALHLIARHCGQERAQQSVRHMVMNAKREASFPQAQFSEEAKGVRDDIVRKCVTLMEQTLNAPLPLEGLAAKLEISSRQLSRRFKASLGQTPSRYYRVLRVRYGAWRLMHSTDLVAAIALDAGFVDASHFQREFMKLYKTSPSKYRRLGVTDKDRRLSKAHAQA